MIDDRTKMLAQSVEKLYRRGARQNIQKVFIKTHTADIAAVLESFSSEERLDLFKMVVSIDDRAKILSYFEEETQKNIAKLLTREELAELAELMDSDDLADLLGLIDEEVTQDILDTMDTQDSEDVTGLMGYREDSAGGIMSSDYVALDQNSTVEQTIQAIHAEDVEGSIVFYIYVVNEHGQLIGVLSLKQLLLSKKSQCLKDLMIPDVLSVDVNADQEAVAKMVEHYDFLSIPVVDSSNKLVGVITVDDVIDVIREEAEEGLMSMGLAGIDSGASFSEHFRARIPWLLFSFVGGILCYLVIHVFLPPFIVESTGPLGLLVGFVPLVLTIGATAGNQSATTSMTALRMSSLGSRDIKELLKKEVLLSLAFGSTFAVITFVLTHFLLESDYSLILTVSLSLQIFISMIIGGGTPLLMSSLGLNPIIGSVPFFTLLADIAAMAVLFGSAYGISH